MSAFVRAHVRFLAVLFALGVLLPFVHLGIQRSVFEAKGVARSHYAAMERPGSISRERYVEEATAETRRLAEWVYVASFGSALLLAAAALFFDRRWQGVKKFLGTEKDLETRVRHRTEQLVADKEGLTREIARRKETEQSLRESEERYRRLVELTPDAILLQQEGRVIFANPAAVSLLGVKAEADLIGKETSSLVHASSHQSITSRLRLPAGGQAPFVEEKLLRWDGTTFDAEVGAIAFAYQGVHSVLLIVRDISARKLLEERMRQSQKMEAIGRLAGGVAHDFNNLLTVISGRTEFLLSSLDPDSPLEEGVAEIRRASESAASLTRQLLAFGRKQIRHPKVLELNEVVDDIQRMLRRLIQNDIEFVFRPGDGPLWVRVDPGQLEQIVMNLVLNARDAMPDGGTLTVETSRSDPASASPGGSKAAFAVLSVSDTGEGIDKQDIAHVFEPYFTTKPDGKGTGLGLSTVYGIVQQSDGLIRVESGEKGGAVFTVSLPLHSAKPEAERGEETDWEKRPDVAATVLVVEDSDMVRNLACHILERHGYRVLQAGDGEKGLALSREHDGRIDLLLTDVMMPKMNGPELAGHVARHRPEARVLYMSGYAEGVIAREGLLTSDAAFLTKPFTVGEFLARVREALCAARDPYEA